MGVHTGCHRVPQPNQSCIFFFFFCLPFLLLPILADLTDFCLVSQFPCMPPSSKSPGLFLNCPGLPLFFPSSLFPASFTYNYVVPFLQKKPQKQLLLIFLFFSSFKSYHLLSSMTLLSYSSSWGLN